MQHVATKITRYSERAKKGKDAARLDVRFLTEQKAEKAENEPGKGIKKIACELVKLQKHDSYENKKMLLKY